MNHLIKSLICLFALQAMYLRAQQPKFDSLLYVINTAKEDTNKAKAFISLSDICDEKDILKYAEPGLELSQKLGYKKGIAKTLNNIGYNYFIKGNSAKAEEYWFKALKMAEEIKDNNDISTMLNNIAFIYDLEGKIEKSLDYYLKSLAIREKMGDKLLLANSYNNLALLYGKLENYTKALEYNFKTLHLLESVRDEHGVAKSLSNIGIIYATQKKNEEAIKYYKKSLNIRNRIKDSLGAADVMVNIGTYYCDKGLNDTALYFYSHALRIKSKIDDKVAMASILTGIASVYLRKNNYSAAEEYGNKAWALSKELGYPVNIRDVSKVLSQVYKYQKKYKQAYDMQVWFKNMSDSVNKTEIANSLVKKQMQYDFEKKETATRAEQEKKDILAEEEKQLQRTIIYSAISGLFLVLLLAIFIYRGYRQKQKDNIVITHQKEEVVKAKILIEHQKELVDEKQKEILDSIHYAKRIQNALLASDALLEINLNGRDNYFVYFNPKDIVSGDFYWATTVNRKQKTDGSEPSGIQANSDCRLFYLAVCDSTGHGVPGAFMSLLNMGFLSEAIKEKDIYSPDEVLNYVRRRLVESISSEGQKDGFDGILMCINKSTGKVTYAASNNNPVIISCNSLSFLPADKMPVGQGESMNPFTLNTIDCKAGDQLYLYTDGYADQFGGPKGKKFKYKQLDEVLLNNHHLSLSNQSQNLKSTFEKWKGDLEQVDDVLVVGIKI
ncbi:MAG: tetratricopeptide repeat protein [Bacteroidia bacterium]